MNETLYYFDSALSHIEALPEYYEFLESFRIVSESKQEAALQTSTSASVVATDTTSASSSFKTFYDKDSGISFDYPDNWTEQDKESFSLYIQLGDKGPVIAFVAMDWTGYRDTIQNELGGWNESTLAYVMDLEEDKIEKRTIGSHEFYTYESSQAGSSYEFAYAYENDYLFWFDYVAQRAAFETYKPIYHQVLGSIR